MVVRPRVRPSRVTWLGVVLAFVVMQQSICVSGLMEASLVRGKHTGSVSSLSTHHAVASTTSTSTSSEAALALAEILQTKGMESASLGSIQTDLQKAAPALGLSQADINPKAIAEAIQFLRSKQQGAQPAGGDTPGANGVSHLRKDSSSASTPNESPHPTPAPAAVPLPPSPTPQPAAVKSKKSSDYPDKVTSGSASSLATPPDGTVEEAAQVGTTRGTRAPNPDGSCPAAFPITCELDYGHKECVDLTNSDMHCGECGTTCGPGLKCIGSKCEDVKKPEAPKTTASPTSTPTTSAVTGDAAVGHDLPPPATQTSPPASVSASASSTPSTVGHPLPSPQSTSSGGSGSTSSGPLAGISESTLATALADALKKLTGQSPAAPAAPAAAPTPPTLGRSTDSPSPTATATSLVMHKRESPAPSAAPPAASVPAAPEGLTGPEKMGGKDLMCGGPPEVKCETDDGVFICANSLTSNEHCGECHSECGQGLTCVNGACGSAKKAKLGLAVAPAFPKPQSISPPPAVTGATCQAVSQPLQQPPATTPPPAVSAHPHSQSPPTPSAPAAAAAPAPPAAAAAPAAASAPAAAAPAAAQPYAISSVSHHRESATSTPTPTPPAQAPSKPEVKDCPPKQTLCMGWSGAMECADTKTSVDHCGGCESYCGAGMACENGQCEVNMKRMKQHFQELNAKKWGLPPPPPLVGEGAQSTVPSSAPAANSAAPAAALPPPPPVTSQSTTLPPPPPVTSSTLPQHDAAPSTIASTSLAPQPGHVDSPSTAGADSMLNPTAMSTPPLTDGAAAAAHHPQPATSPLRKKEVGAMQHGPTRLEVDVQDPENPASPLYKKRELAHTAWEGSEMTTTQRRELRELLGQMHVPNVKFMDDLALWKAGEAVKNDMSKHPLYGQLGGPEAVSPSSALAQTHPIPAAAPQGAAPTSVAPCAANPAAAAGSNQLGGVEAQISQLGGLKREVKSAGGREVASPALTTPTIPPSSVTDKDYVPPISAANTMWTSKDDMTPPLLHREVADNGDGHHHHHHHHHHRLQQHQHHRRDTVHHHHHHHRNPQP